MIQATIQRSNVVHVPIARVAVSERELSFKIVGRIWLFRLHWTCVFCAKQNRKFAQDLREFANCGGTFHEFVLWCNMSKSLIFSADVHKFVICGCYANLGRRKKVSNAICCTTTDYELLCIRTQDEWIWHVFESIDHKTNSWKVPLQFANSRKTCANLRFCFAQKTQVHGNYAINYRNYAVLPYYRIITANYR